MSISLCNVPRMACSTLSRMALSFVFCALGIISGAMAQQPVRPAAVGWLGLYNAALVEWLDNDNNLKALCPYADAGSSAWRECRDSMLKPKRHAVQLRSAPHATAPLEGILIVQATPGQGLQAYYRPAHGRKETAFVPDLFDADWGYGPYFHQTFLERRGTWFLLPAVPFARPVWVDASEFSAVPDARLLGAGDIITLRNEDLVVTAVERGAIRVRREQKADMWCEADAPPPLKPSAEIRIPFGRIVGQTGHLLPDIKYKRGC